MCRRILFVGPDPDSRSTRHAGGQLTAARGLASYALSRGVGLIIVDTFVDSLAARSLFAKLAAGCRRVGIVMRNVRSRSASAMVLFVGARSSFFERSLLAAIARAYGVKTVFCIRDGAFIGWMKHSPVLEALIRLLLHIPSRIVLQGNRARNELISRALPADRFAIVRNWLPHEFRVAAKPRAVLGNETLRLVYVGWLVRDKGIVELIRACSALSERHRFTLEIVGGGPMEKELCALIREDGNLNVVVHGWLGADDVRQCLERGHVFVMPSYYEGFPNALLEAMACGLATVCTDVGAISETITDGINGFLVPVRDIAALAGGIEKYLVDPGLVAVHGAAALDTVRQLHNADDNLAVLFSCLSNP